MESGEWWWPAWQAGRLRSQEGQPHNKTLRPGVSALKTRWVIARRRCAGGTPALPGDNHTKKTLRPCVSALKLRWGDRTTTLCRRDACAPRGDTLRPRVSALNNLPLPGTKKEPRDFSRGSFSISAVRGITRGTCGAGRWPRRREPRGPSRSVQEPQPICPHRPSCPCRRRCRPPR